MPPWYDNKLPTIVMTLIIVVFLAVPVLVFMFGKPLDMVECLRQKDCFGTGCAGLNDACVGSSASLYRCINTTSNAVLCEHWVCSGQENVSCY